MAISINGRQLEITPTLREWITGRLNNLNEDPVLKTTQLNVMIDRVKNSFKASLVLNCKYHVISADAEDFELGKAVDDAARKLEAQAKVLRDKIRSHKSEGLSANESRKAEEEQI